MDDWLFDDWPSTMGPTVAAGTTPGQGASASGGLLSGLGLDLSAVTKPISDASAAVLANFEQIVADVQPWLIGVMVLVGLFLVLMLIHEVREI